MRETRGVDESLTQVVNWFRNQDHMVARFGAAIRRSLDEVVDGQRTGRYSIDELSKVEKTYIGTKVEILVQAEFGLQEGLRMDYSVAGHEVDAKWSKNHGGWMIPREAIGELCLCLTADDEGQSSGWAWCGPLAGVFGRQGTKIERRNSTKTGCPQSTGLPTGPHYRKTCCCVFGRPPESVSLPRISVGRVGSPRCFDWYRVVSSTGEWYSPWQDRTTDRSGYAMPEFTCAAVAYSSSVINRGTA